MPRTYFQDFIRDDGSPVTVEYSFQRGSPTTYSPMYGADGGDGCEVEIVSVMPNTPEYERLCSEVLYLGGRHSIAAMSAEARLCLQELDESIAIEKRRVALTDAENERMCNWLAEHHLDQSDDELDRMEF
jgi:hypothetical protein